MRLLELQLIQQSFASIFPLHEIEVNVHLAKVSTFAYSRYAAPPCCIAPKCEKQETEAASSLPPLCFSGAHSSPCDCKIHLPASPCHQYAKISLSNKSLYFFRTRGSTANKQKQRGGRTAKAEPTSRSCAAGRISTAVCCGLQNYFWPLLQM